MPRATIDYMNARRECRAASGGANYAVESDQDRKRRLADERARDLEADGVDTANNAIRAFSLWAETTRQVLVAKLGIPQHNEACDEIPF